MNERLDGGLVQVPQVTGGLPGLLAQHHGLGADETEGIYHHLALHTLHGVHHDSYCTLVQSLKALQAYMEDDTLLNMEKRTEPHNSAGILGR
jgi:hypothetical protein